MLPDLKDGDLVRCERTGHLFHVGKVLFVGHVGEMLATAILEPLPRRGFERCERCADTNLQGDVCQVCNHIQERGARQ